MQPEDLLIAARQAQGYQQPIVFIFLMVAHAALIMCYIDVNGVKNFFVGHPMPSQCVTAQVLNIKSIFQIRRPDFSHSIDQYQYVAQNLTSNALE